MIKDISITELRILAELYKRNNPTGIDDFTDSIMTNLKHDSDQSVDDFVEWLELKSESKSFKQLRELLKQV